MAEAMIVVLALLTWAVVLAIVGVVLRVRRGRPTERDAHLEELRARYARGEIDFATYQHARRRALDNGSRRRAG